MDLILPKYNNFRQLCLDKFPKNEWVLFLQNTQLTDFLNTIKLRKLNNKSPEDIYKIMIETAKIDEDDVLEEDEQKINRYINYFTKVVDLI